MTELEVCMTIQCELHKAGGELWRSPTLVFGERTRLAHGAPARNPIKNNEPAMMELGGSKHGYAAGLVRSAVLGRHRETESLHSLAEETLETAIAAIKPGVIAGEVDAVARNVLERSGRPNVFRHRTGYQSGINWLERGNMSLQPGASEILQAGMTFHIPILLFSESGHICGCSENVLVTERGSELLSRTPHTLYRA